MEPPAPCSRCEAFKPEPTPDGNLRVDPDIHLPSVGMDVDIASFYNANSNYNGPYGYGRTISPNQLCQASGTPTMVSLTRGNGSMVSYLNNGSGTYLPQTYGLINSLVQDTTNSYWRETTPGGVTTAYPLNTTGMITSMSWIQDACGNTQTMSYATGLLTGIMDPVGRRVTLAYTSGLLQSIQDWDNRLTTFLYNTTLVSGKPVLTTITGPTGCQTVYEYNTTPLLTGITDPNGYLTSYSYDGSNRVVTKYVPGVGTTSYSYATNKMTIQNALGYALTQALGSAGVILGVQNALGQMVTFLRNNGFENQLQNPAGSIATTLYDLK